MGNQITYLSWGIFDRFLGYVLRSNGSVTAHLPCRWDEELNAFRFPLIGIEATAEGTSARFDGAVRMVAHGGALDVLLVDPVVEFSEAGGRLSIETDWDDDFARIEVAALDLRASTRNGFGRGYLLQGAEATATLSGHGPAWLGGVYPRGTELAPVRFVARTPIPT